MSLRSSPSTVTADVASLAIQLADALERDGDFAGGEAALALAAAHEVDDRVAMRIAERALARGDAAAAMRALIPAWEAGSPDPHLEVLLAVSALALGLDDVCQSLTDPPCATGEHALVRLILAAKRNERIDVMPAMSTTERIWGLRALLRILADCGRADFVHHVVARAEALAIPGLTEALAGLPSTPPPSREVCTPPIAESRAAFAAAWDRPATDAVFNWAWTVSREVMAGERALLLGEGAPALRPLFRHGATTVVAAQPAPGVDAVGAPEALPVAPGRWHHVVAVGWISETLCPEAALAHVVAAMPHGGQLHLLVPGPRAAGADLLRLSVPAVEGLLARAGLVVEGVVGRSAEGLDVPPDEAALVIARAQRSVV